MLKNVQDFFNFSMQYKDLISLLYSKHDIVLDNTLIRIAGRSLSKRCYLPFKTEFKDSLINLSNILNQGKHSSNSHYLIVEKNQTFEDFKQLFFLSYNVKDILDHKHFEYLHEFLLGYTLIFFINNIFITNITFITVAVVIIV